MTRIWSWAFVYVNDRPGTCSTCGRALRFTRIRDRHGREFCDNNRCRPTPTPR